MNSFKKNPISSPQLSVVFESMLEGVVIHNEGGEIIQYNQAALNILGLTADQLLGRTSFDPMWRAINQDHTPATPETHPSTIARKQGITVKDRIMGVHLPNGSLSWMSIVAVPIFKDSTSEVDQVVVTFSDITELIGLTNEVADRERSIQMLFDSLPALVGHWDRDLINIRSNRLYADYFGKTPAEVKGRHICEIIGEVLFEKNKVFIDRALAGELQTFERDILTPKGLRNTIATYIPDKAQGDVRGFYVLVYDVTDLKQLERERKEAEARLLGNVRLSWLGEMAGGIAHEINNPLAIILGNIAVSKMKIEKNELNAQDLLGTFSRLELSIERITKIVKGLIQFSGEGERAALEKVKISGVLEDLNGFVSERLKKRSIGFVVEDYEDRVLRVVKMDVIQSLTALIFNAIDAVEGRSEKWIRLKVLHRGTEVAFVLQDSGPRIPQEIAEKMMLPFFTTKPPGKGVGLGLSVARSIANKYQGDLVYDAAAPQTTFTFTLKFL